MTHPYVNIHTHRPAGPDIGLCTAGVHPWHAAECRGDIPGALPAGIQAVGETGLDFACGTDRGSQYEVFRAQLRLARDTGLPVVIHCVRAFGEVVRELTACPPRAVIFHGFIGSPEQAQQALRRGYYLSFGERTFSSPRTVEALLCTPLDRLFLETDDSPVAIGEIYARAAQIRGISVAELQRTTLENYERLFGKHNG